MIIVKNENGITFLNEKEFYDIVYNRKKKKVFATPVEGPERKFCGFEAEKVESVTFVNDAHPTIMRFDNEKPVTEESLLNTRLARLEIDIPFHWVRFLNVVRKENIDTLGDLLKVSPEQVIKLRNCGYKCVTAVQKALKEKYNIDW